MKTLTIPTEQELKMIGKKGLGLYAKFIIKRTDGKHRQGQKHHDCIYFVLDTIHDKYAKAALRAYAKACRKEYPLLAKDIQENFLNQKGLTPCQ